MKHKKPRKRKRKTEQKRIIKEKLRGKPKENQKGGGWKENRGENSQGGKKEQIINRGNELIK